MKNILKNLNWEKGGGLIPAIIQDSTSNLVLMLGFMNKDALTKTLKTKKIWFYSRTRKKLWMKGEQSKNTLKVVEIASDCDNDTLLVKVKPKGPTCHTGSYSCFNEKHNQNILEELFTTILDRKKRKPKNSYTAFLFHKGLNKICAKIKEEALEVIKASQKETKKRLIEESSDLIYHIFVLLAEKNIQWNSVIKELNNRKK